MKKNLYLYITLGVLVIFTVIYFVIANNVSYAFEYNEQDALYENKIMQIETIAKIYAVNNPDLFKDKDSIYMTVEDLVNLGIMSSEDGKVKDPRSEVLTLNDLKLRITKDDNNFNIKVLS